MTILVEMEKVVLGANHTHSSIKRKERRRKDIPDVNSKLGAAPVSGHRSTAYLPC